MGNLRAYLGWLLVRIGYAVRPYDMPADRRRWWWQPRTPCGYQRGIRVDEATMRALRRRGGSA